MQLAWNKCQGNVWCNLNNVNLGHSHFDAMDGVYVIWHGGPQPATVRVGKGHIRDLFAANRTDPRVQAFAQYGLFATWAAVSPPQQAGTEAFLVSRLNPKVTDYLMPADPIEVTLPW